MLSVFHKKIILFSGILIGALTVGCLTLVASSHTQSATLVRMVLPTPPPMPTPVPTATPEPGLTMLLMGKGGLGHEGGALTDTMLLVRIMQSTRTILMLTIPRDLWVSIPQPDGSFKKGKINSANVMGGGSLAKTVVTTVTGLSVDKYLTIDFSGFEQAIDSIGGIDVTVNPAFTDYEYPISGREDMDCTQEPSPNPSPNPTATTVSLKELLATGKLDATKLTGLPAQYPCRYELLHFDAGFQHMDGVTALKFVRSRHSAEAGNDFSRGSRQQQVIEAVANKLLSMGAVAKIPSFFATLRSHIDTDLGAGDILGLLPQATTLKSYQVVQKALSIDNYLTQDYTVDRQYALFPLTGEANYIAIQNAIASSITPSIPLQFPVVNVQGNPEDAKVLVSQLVAAGYPAHVARSSSKVASSSATILVQDSNVSQKVIDAIAQIVGTHVHILLKK